MKDPPIKGPKIVTDRACASRGYIEFNFVKVYASSCGIEPMLSSYLHYNNVLLLHVRSRYRYMALCIQSIYHVVSVDRSSCHVTLHSYNILEEVSQFVTFPRSAAIVYP